MLEHLPKCLIFPQFLIVLESSYLSVAGKKCLEFSVCNVPVGTLLLEVCTTKNLVSHLMTMLVVREESRMTNGVDCVST